MKTISKTLRKAAEHINKLGKKSEKIHFVFAQNDDNMEARLEKVIWNLINTGSFRIEYLIVTLLTMTRAGIPGRAPNTFQVNFCYHKI